MSDEKRAPLRKPGQTVWHKDTSSLEIAKDVIRQFYGEPEEAEAAPHQTGTADEVEHCPACGSTEWIPIVYGLPDPELFAAEGRGDVAIGGCIMFPERPDVECRQCSTQYRSQFRPDDDKYEDWSDDPPTDR